MERNREPLLRYGYQRGPFKERTVSCNLREERGQHVGPPTQRKSISKSWGGVGVAETGLERQSPAHRAHRRAMKSEMASGSQTKVRMWLLLYTTKEGSWRSLTLGREKIKFFLGSKKTT